MTLQAVMTGVKGKGTTLKMGSSAEALTTVAKVLKITPPKLSVNMDEATPLTTAVAVERSPGIPDWTGCKFTVGFDPAETVLVAAAKAAAIKFFAIVFGNSPATTHTFQGAITNFEIGEIDAKTGLLQATFEITPSGDVEITTAS